jgi:hypothetical protein
MYVGIIMIGESYLVGALTMYVGIIMIGES